MNSDVAKARYQDKVAIIGLDPCALREKAFDDLTLLPMVEYPDICYRYPGRLYNVMYTPII